jgi:hypothetical protein
MWVEHEELWVPWEIASEHPTYIDHDGTVKPRWSYEAADLPDELVERFLAAKAEIEALWQEIGERIIE